MALARLSLKNLQGKLVSPSSSLLPQNLTEKSLSNTVQKQRWGLKVLRGFSTSAADAVKASDDNEVAVSDGGGEKGKLFSGRKRNKGLWRNNRRDDVPALWEFFPSGLGNALVQASENINRLLQHLTPSQLMGKFKEKDDYYKLRYHLPGLTKEDVKITVEDGVLRIKGEHKEVEEDGSDDEHWSSGSYGYYETMVVLPEDAKPDEIKAEMKNGVLSVIVPKSGEKQSKDVTEVQVE